MYPLYTAGYSEGAAYSIWFSKCFNSNYTECPYISPSTYINSSFYTYKASAGLDGAYVL